MKIPSGYFKTSPGIIRLVVSLVPLMSASGQPPLTKPVQTFEFDMKPSSE
jgi:hypothetical protein